MPGAGEEGFVCVMCPAARAVHGAAHGAVHVACLTNPRAIPRSRVDENKDYVP